MVNDNGGTATVADFTLTADGTGSNDLSGTSPVDTGAGLQRRHLGPERDRTLRRLHGQRLGLRRWHPGRCDATSPSALGGEATCTITNDDIAPKLHLRKVVVNDNGGTATVANFTLTANGTGTNDLSGTSPVDSGAGLQATPGP